jgi:lipopolysaccharide transport protein LptA
MSWQRKARIGIAIFAIVFIAIVVVALRKPKVAPTTIVLPKRSDQKATSETGPGEHTKYKDGKIVLAVKFGKQLTYPEGRAVFKDVVLTLPDRGGRTFTVSGSEAELLNKPGQEIGRVHLMGGVKLTTSDGATVTGADATYDDATGILEVPGEVGFTRGRMKGEGIGATYDKHRDVLWLLDKAHVAVAADPKGQGALDATAGSLGVARADHYLKLLRTGHITTEGRTIDADEITVKLAEDNERMQSLELRGNSRMSGGSSGPQSMSARDIDLAFADDGRTMQHAQLMENGVVQLPGEGKGPGRRVAGKTIDIALGPDGSTLTNLTATEAVQVDLPSEGDLPAKRIRSATLVATGTPAAGLQTANFGGNVEYRETRAARGAVTAIDRTARAQTLVVNTRPGFGAVQQADFHGAVVITDVRESGNVEVVAPRVLYHVERDQMDLSPPGDPGEGPRVSDGRVTVNARTIEFTLSSRKLKAETSVSSSLLPNRQPASRGNGPSKARAETKVPSMLKQDQPVNVTSNRLEYDGAAGHARYMGNAKLWQGDTSVYADTIVVDDKTGNLEATGGVRTRMMVDDVDPQTKQKKTVLSKGDSETFFYEDAKRLATYTTKAHMEGPQGDVTADKLELFMKSGSNELERAEGYGAKGSVVVKDERRTAKGDRLTYTTSDDTYVLTGKPVEVIEIMPNDCKQSFGTTLRFQRGGRSIGSLDGSADRARGVTIPCPTEPR